MEPRFTTLFQTEGFDLQEIFTKTNWAAPASTKWLENKFSTIIKHNLLAPVLTVLSDGYRYPENSNIKGVLIRIHVHKSPK